MSAKPMGNQLDDLFAESTSSVSESTPNDTWEAPDTNLGLVELGKGDPSQTGGQRSLVTFRLGKQIYAIPIEPIHQIVEMVTITPLPQLDDLITGVINVREQAIPVVNMRHHFKMPPAPPNLDPHILLVQLSHWKVGLIVDQVLDVLALSNEQIIPIPEILPDTLGELPILKGLVHHLEQTVMLLDLDSLFLPHQQTELSEALAMISEEE